MTSATHDVWTAIGADPSLARARRVLSMEELRTICRHAWANLPDQARDRAKVRQLITGMPQRRYVLADLIRTRLLGVRPDDQDLVLEDKDWTEIIAALSEPSS